MNKLFTSPLCPACPQAKKLLKGTTYTDKGMSYIEYNVATSEGLMEASLYGIHTVPSFVYNDIVYVGLEDIETLAKGIIK